MTPSPVAGPCHDLSVSIDRFAPWAWGLAGLGSAGLGLFVGGKTAGEFEPEWNLAVFAVVVISGGVLMIARARRRPRTSRAGWVAGVAGLVGGMAAPMWHTCCDVVWTVGVGFPMPWAGGFGDTLGQAFREAWQGQWDPVSAVLNAVFWAHVGMIVAAVSGLRMPTRPAAVTSGGG